MVLRYHCASPFIYPGQRCYTPAGPISIPTRHCSSSRRDPRHVRFLMVGAQISWCWMPGNRLTLFTSSMAPRSTLTSGWGLKHYTSQGSSPMTLAVTGFHLCVYVTTCRREKVSLTLRLFFSSFLLIQFRACCCGSIHNGKRLARVVRMPFWTESSSGGKPCDPHLEEKQFREIGFPRDKRGPSFPKRDFWVQRWAIHWKISKGQLICLVIHPIYW